ncbi:hypothetical protein GCM10010300_64800 [Streptomyces olivaceoviridis]|uniref:hypothetical protein n=1 Tax=Streptomyces olivaceoviridis TaxID=1921 RepID=UPI00167BE5FE|nr:hypothetical protein [Streptomyces olivaceoviridis]GGZ11693.1 hypothetical protein GCM10010300_64800 [Streptomyces olivaceoviridis]
MAEQKSSALTAPLRGAASVLRRVPGAGTVTRAAEETLDKVGAVSPRGRRMAVYAGAGVLGAAGVVEWPVALTGAAVAWLTQPRPAQPVGAAETAPPAEPAHDPGTAALGSGGGEHGPGQAAGTGTAVGTQAPVGTAAPGPAKEPGTSPASGPPEGAHGVRASAGKTSSGSHGPTARPDRTTL